MIVVDHVSFLRGKHAFKFGAETLFLRPYLGNRTGGRGVFDFGDNGNGTLSPVLPPWRIFSPGIPTAQRGRHEYSMATRFAT